MKEGDLVRFAQPGPWEPKTRLGLLIEYETWEKLARIMPIPYDGKVVTIHASHVEKAGKKDIEAIQGREGI